MATRLGYPAPQGLRLDQEAPKPLAAVVSCQPGQRRSVRGLQHRFVDLASKARRHVSGYDDLSGRPVPITKLCIM